MGRAAGRPVPVACAGGWGRGVIGATGGRGAGGGGGRKQIIPAEEEDQLPTEKFHQCLTFTYAGDFDARPKPGRHSESRKAGRPSRAGGSRA